MASEIGVTRHLINTSRGGSVFIFQKEKKYSPFTFYFSYKEFLNF